MVVRRDDLREEMIFCQQFRVASIVKREGKFISKIIFKMFTKV